MWACTTRPPGSAGGDAFAPRRATLETPMTPTPRCAPCLPCCRSCPGSWRGTGPAWRRCSRPLRPRQGSPACWWVRCAAVARPWRPVPLLGVWMGGWRACVTATPRCCDARPPIHPPPGPTVSPPPRACHPAGARFCAPTHRFPVHASGVCAHVGGGWVGGGSRRSRCVTALPASGWTPQL